MPPASHPRSATWPVDDDRHDPRAPVLVSNGFQSEYEVGIANGLAAHGVAPILICSDRLETDRLDANVVALNLRGSQDPARSRRAKAVNILRYWRRLLALLRRGDGRVVHVIGLFTLRSSLAALVEAMVLRLVARRLVLTVHNVLPHDGHTRFNRWAYRRLYRLPHALVVHTERMRQLLQFDYGVDVDRVVVMEHGIDRILPPLPASRQRLRERFGIAAARPVVLFFGGVARYKGLDLLLDAMRGVRHDAVLVVAGQCRDVALRREIAARIEPLVDAGHAVWFDGFVAEDDVLDHFHGADVLAMPYRHIDQSGVVFMALATGLPVVAFDVGSLADYVPLTGGRVVPAGDVASLAAAIDAQLATAPSSRGAALAHAQRFLWSRTVTPLLAAYARASPIASA